RYASATNSLELTYDGIFTSAIMGLDFQLHLDIRDPRYTQNYFGLGNETEQGSDDKDFNRVRIGHLGIHPELSKTINNNTFSLGLFYQQYNIEETPERFISDIPANGLDPEIFENQDYTGINARYQFDTRNSQTLPTRGLYWNTNASFYYDLDNAGKTFNQFTSELSLFMSFKKPYRTVFAFRVGGNMNLGDYEFFQASSLGGKTNLRGYRATRFSGDASLYQNSEIRFKLFKFSTYISKGELGVLVFNDIGRVWLEGENSNRWHHGYGGGIWASPFNIAVLSATYERSKDELAGLFSLRFKFLF
ncbi:MAG: BamA/TamA family outer membrane protein, partial [Spirochaetales bacterium]|nr:BamA/TamA family outer membrane protein [Spirochaetales bacterium]